MDEDGRWGMGLSGPFSLTGNGSIPEGLCEAVRRAFAEGREKEVLSSFYTFWVDKSGEEQVLFCYYGRGLDHSLYVLV